MSEKVHETPRNSIKTNQHEQKRSMNFDMFDEIRCKSCFNSFLFESIFTGPRAAPARRSGGPAQRGRPVHGVQMRKGLKRGDVRKGKGSSLICLDYDKV